MEEDFEICLVSSSIEKEPNGTISGIIFFRINHVPFPDDQWNDNIVIILSWWIEALNRFSTTDDQMIEFQFMEGPYRLTIEKINPELCKITTLERSSKTTTQHQITSSAIRNKLEKAIKEVIKVCTQNQWKSEELDSLMSNLSVT